MRILKKMPSFNAVAAGQTAICNLPVGMAYHQIILRYDRGAGPAAATLAQFVSDILRIRLMVDGDAIWDITGEELIAIYAYYGIFDTGFTDGVLPLFFSRPWQRTSQSEDYTQLGTADVQNMTLEVDIAGGVTNPRLSAYAAQGKNAPLGVYVCMRRFNYTASATGVREIPDLPRGPYSAIAIHAKTANIADVVVEANGRNVLEGDKAILEGYYEQTQRQWQTGWWHMDFAPTDRVTDALPLSLEDFRLKLNMTGTGAFPLIMERLESRRVAAA